MKVLLIDVNCKNSSTGKIVYDLYSNINANGDEASICYGRGPKIKEKNIFKFGLDWETYLHALLARITGYNGCFSFFSTKRLLRYIKKFQPDVVHIHELHAYFVNLKPLLTYLKKSNIKVVHTLHCAYSFTGKCGSTINCEKWKTECKNCPRKKEYVSSLFFDRTQKMFYKKKKLFSGFKDLTIVCPSEWLANQARQSFLSEYNVKVIHNGINTDIFRPKDASELRKTLNIKSDEKVVLSVAPNIMSDAKGGPWVIKIAERLSNEKIKFILVGADDVESSYPSNCLVFKRTNNQDELATFYSLADVFLLCSISETFSMTCVESLCCGTPIVGFKCGAPETIFLKPYAHFFEYGDVNKLVNYLYDVLSYRNNIYEISNWAFDHFSNSRMCEEYIKLYK